MRYVDAPNSSTLAPLANMRSWSGTGCSFFDLSVDNKYQVLAGIHIDMIGLPSLI
jgi:hypothetical protein